MTLRVLDLFSGIGGFAVAGQLVGGFKTVQFVEIDPWCRQVLKQHWPEIPIHDDIATFEGNLGTADVVVGGFPCQDISTAGKGAGIKEGTRSGLFYELMRVVCQVRPQYVVLENVAAIRSRGLDTVLGELAAAGFDAEWACIRASDVGACHRRDRWWCVAYAQDRRRGAREGQGASETGHQVSGTGNGRGAFASAHPNYSGPQGLRPERQLREGGSQITPTWSGSRQLSSDWRRYISEPVLCRGDDGLRDRTHRLRALGNAVVPQVAAIPLTRVRQLHEGGVA